MNHPNRWRWLAYGLQAVLIILTLIIIFLLITNRSDIAGRVSAVEDNLSSIGRPQDGLDGLDGDTPVKNIDYRDGKDGYTPVKGVDYNDGKDGLNGVNGSDGAKGDKGNTGDQGAPGPTPYLRCNTVKNRWEVRYDNESAWMILNGEIVRCTIPVIGPILAP